MESHDRLGMETAEQEHPPGLGGILVHTSQVRFLTHLREVFNLEQGVEDSLWEDESQPRSSLSGLALT